MSAALAEFGIEAVEAAVTAASGWSGLFVILVYSFLIAFILPLPSEVVLCPIGYVCAGNTLGLGIPIEAQVVLVILFSSIGKAAGSLIALYVGHGASHSGPVIRAAERLGLDPVGWSRSRMVELTSRWGYLGMAIGLSVPGFPDTLSIYAFSILENDYAKFAAAAFAGSVGRLVITVAALEGIIVLA